MRITLYGIPNCDQVKKARSWLSEHAIVANFHDVKKDGITPDLLNQWISSLNDDWQTCLNRRGTTWRTLTTEEQAAVIDRASAIECMVKSPSIIKRPILVVQTGQKIQVLVGFSEANYLTVFKIQV